MGCAILAHLGCTWHRSGGRVASVALAVILEVADVDHKGKVRCVDGREQALDALEVKDPVKAAKK
jgi:hypothetical protein